jgi:hypothetical protein
VVVGAATEFSLPGHEKEGLAAAHSKLWHGAGATHKSHWRWRSRSSQVRGKKLKPAPAARPPTGIVANLTGAIQVFCGWQCNQEVTRHLTK